MTQTLTNTLPATQSETELFSTVLVANRGEIACRVIATLHDLGIRSVAVYSEADADAEHVRKADEAVLVGPAAAAESYLDIDAVVNAALATGAEAIHPGYGFLSENVRFARACEAAGLTFIGPGTEALDVMGDKIRSKNHIEAAGVPTVAGISQPSASNEELIAAAEDMPFPLLIKPSAGGGGKGMHVVERVEELPEVLATARRVATASFGDDTLLIEQLIRSPRHIEVQVLADAHGSVIHLGERECSLQRRHQKVIEEAPSPLLDAETRQRIGEAACETARSVDYLGAGTVEFLVSDVEPDKFYFMEMNTRLQVEHPVTEQVTGVDLVEQQIRIAAGHRLSFTQQDITLTGHSVEARVYAEVPEAGFLPSIGTVADLTEPAGTGVRVDSGLHAGTVIGTDYDPMLAKVIATGTDREQAMTRLHRALGEMVVLGVETNLSYLQQLISDDDVRAARMDTTMIERKLPQMTFPRPEEALVKATVAFAAQATPPDAAARLGTAQQAWRTDGWRPTGAVRSEYLVTHQPPQAELTTFSVSLDDSVTVRPVPGHSHTYQVTAEGRTTTMHMVLTDSRPEGSDVWVWSPEFTGMVTVLDRQAQTLQTLAQIEAEQVEAVPEVTAPLPGTVIEVVASSDQDVTEGDHLLTIEAMKMEHRMVAPLDGIATITVTEGQQVKLGQVVARVHAPTDADTDSSAESAD